MGYIPKYDPVDMNCPVHKISWYEVIEYCNKRSVKENLTPVYSVDSDTDPVDWASGVIECDWSANGYRIPTEAEWEYAARGGVHKSEFTYSGSDDLDEVGWYRENSGNYYSLIHRIAKKKPNALGIFDMSGNVREWCWDFYDDDYYKNSPKENPKGPETGDRTVARGGYYGDYSKECKVTARLKGTRNDKYVSNGFRLVRSKQ